MKRLLLPVAILGLVGLAAQQAQAAAFAPTDLDSLALGAKIVGPVGPEVETTFVNDSGDGIGDLVSSVSCPAGFSSCLPPTNPAGTLYTYIHQVTPGVNFPNDPPFPAPGVILPVEGVEAFRLNFPAAGFNGVAGYSFAEAATALGESNSLTVEEAGDGSLVWRAPADAGWDTNETISFFWQTTQNPSGPGGIYGLLGDGQSGTANGPLPTPVVVAPPATEVPEGSAIAALTLLGLSGLLLKRQTLA
ncbi:MAG: exosortase, PEP-CTERM interaction domain protein [Cyanobacteria bacterium J06598_3]